MEELIVNNNKYGGRKAGTGFRARIESAPHASPHNLLGGHIRSFSSPADPLFFSHHAFIDKLWSMWQVRATLCNTAVVIVGVLRTLIMNTLGPCGR
jgi:hypothetical protein